MTALRAARQLPVIGLALAAGACTFTAGDWFGTLEPAFEARFASRADRDAGGGWQRLSSDYQVKVSRAELTIEDVELISFAAGAGAFDPANPPPGYSLCHNGHCHHESGRLVPYEEIEEELAGSGKGTSVAVMLPVGALDLLNPVRMTPPCEPQCGLPLADIRRARAPVTRIAFEGLIRDGQVPPRIAGEVRFAWTETAASEDDAPAVLDAVLALPVDRKNPPHIRLDLLAELTAQLFDGVDWAAAPRQGTAFDLSAQAAKAAREQLLTNFSETGLKATVSRD